jgi:hypothetical protein
MSDWQWHRTGDDEHDLITPDMEAYVTPYRRGYLWLVTFPGGAPMLECGPARTVLGAKQCARRAMRRWEA